MNATLNRQPTARDLLGSDRWEAIYQEPTMIEAVESAIALHSKPDLAKLEGMVYQVWEDGEVTLTKCGSLLGQRNLHMIYPGHPRAAVPVSLFPHRTTNGHGFIYTDEAGQKAMRTAIFDHAGLFA